MAENKHSDFYLEALKAFDVPVGQAALEVHEPQIAQPEPVITVVAERKAPANGKKWHIIAICAVLMVSLLFCFWPRDPKSASTRGENWIYGTCTNVTEDGFVLTSEDVRWYVSLADGVQPPKEGKMHWVFYNGEPEATSQNDCTLMITATAIRDFSGYSSETYPQYGWIYDEIDFDLDGDGKKEHWILCASETKDTPLIIPGIPYPFGQTLKPSYISSDLRLVALDASGNACYDITFSPPSMGNYNDYIFHDLDDTLFLISRTVWDTLQLRLEAGSVSIYHGDMQIPAVTQSGTFSTEPPIVSLPPEPTAEPQMEYYLTFYFGDEQEKTRVLDTAYSAVLKQQLDDLFWTEDNSKTHAVAGSFLLQTEESSYGYEFTYDGRLLHNGQDATMFTFWSTVFDLMGTNVPVGSTYTATDNKGAKLKLEFTDVHKFHLTYKQPLDDGVYTITSDGLCGSVGDLLILRFEDRNAGILVFDYQNDRLLYREDLSKQYLAQLDDRAVFYNELEPFGISFRYYHGSVFNDMDSYYPTEAGPCRLNPSQMDRIKFWIGQLEFGEMPAEDESIHVIGDFTLHAWATDTQYFYTDTGLLITNNSAAVMPEHLANYLQTLMISAGESMDACFMAEDCNGAPVQLRLYSAGKQFVLEHEGGSPTPGADLGETWGQYVIFGNSLRLFPGNGCTDFIQLWLQPNGGASYVDKLTNTRVDHRLSDAAVFRPVDMFSFAQIDMHIDVDGKGGTVSAGSKVIEVPQGLRYRAAELETALYWMPGYGEAVYANMGRIAFLDGDEPHLCFNIISGKQLEKDGWIASLSNDQWELVVQLMICAGEGSMPGTYEADTQNGKLLLKLHDHNRFSLSGFVTEGIVQSLEGYYVNADCAVLFYGDDGQCFVMREGKDGSLEFLSSNSALWQWDLPNGQLFHKMIVLE